MAAEQSAVKKRRWLRWVLLSAGIVVLVVISYGSYLYYQLNSINLEDVQKRAQQRELGVEPSESPQPLPDLLEKTVDVANGFANKPIDSQDALDAAAILLKSGLSMRDVYFLLGKSTEKLSNEEKQAIRDKLLAKLTPEDIKALRAITKRYGKGLVILDPNYPIELVGVYDEAERKRISQELEEKKRAQSQAQAQTQAAATTDPARPPQPKPSAVPAAPVTAQSGDSLTPASPTNTPDKPSTNPAESSNGKEQLENKYLGQLGQLQSSCSAEATRLMNEIAAQLRSDKQAGKSLSISDLENKYMQRVNAAEGKCDAQFNQLMSQAKQEFSQAGYDSDPVGEWTERYRAAKEALRSKAVQTLSGALSGSG